MNHVERRLAVFLAAVLIPVAAIADGPIASSSFTGVEDPLSENGAWAPLTSLSPSGTRFQKNNGAFPDQFVRPDHAGARTTAALPADHYAEIVIGHLGSNADNLGPTVRVQAAGASVDSHYLWWTSRADGVNNLYRIDADGSSYSATAIVPSSPVVDGDRLRLIARGPVVYGIKNGVRDFIYNTGPDATRYATGTAGMLAWPAGPTLTDATIASWSSGTAPVSSGTWASSDFAGAEDPLDEGDRWYPLPGSSELRKAGGFAIGPEWGHNASGVWSIAPPPTQYSEVTLGTVTGGGGGPMVRIDRTSAGPTGWLLFLSADNPSASGIYKLTPDGAFTPVRQFTPQLLSGDKWRLAADGNSLEVFQNGVSQLTYTTDGAYASGDVGIETYTPVFTLRAWEGGAQTVAPPADAQPPSAPAVLVSLPLAKSQVRLVWTPATDNVAVTGYRVERCVGVACSAFAQVGTATGTTYGDTGLAANTSYSYRVRATDAAGNLGPYSNVATATTLAF